MTGVQTCALPISPVKAPTFLADDIAGMHGALSALAALRHRDRTGEGQHVDVCLLDSLLFHCDGLLTLGATDVPMQEATNMAATANRGVIDLMAGFLKRGETS